MNLELSKIAIVTGGNRGIGAAVATELAREGAEVFLIARDGALLDGVATEIASRFGRRAVAFAADLRRPEAATSAVQACLAAFGQLDILVNNAGTTKRGHFLSLNESDWEEGYAVKLHGYVRMSRSAWPALRQSRWTIVNIVGAGSRIGTAEFTIGGSVNAA
jgi:NAD(P)-dependent dehydrogenase (short-subunit alcohol dehydrogenase family)